MLLDGGFCWSRFLNIGYSSIMLGLDFIYGGIEMNNCVLVNG